MRVLLIQQSAAEMSDRAADLGSAGYVVDSVADADAAFECLAAYDYDIVVLDDVSGDLDGCRIIRRMRARRVETPVLLLAARHVPGIAVTALRVGADDVVTHPVGDEELLARVEAIVRRCHGHAQPSLQVGSVTVDMNSRDVIVAGRPMHLTNKEFGVLQLLALRRGAVVTTQNILNSLYDGLDDPQSRTIEVFICYLRKKLARFNADVIIDTVRGAGYILRPRPMRPAAPVLVSDQFAPAPLGADHRFVPAMAA